MRERIPGLVPISRRFGCLTTSADLETIFYMEGGGLAVTLKKR